MNDTHLIINIRTICTENGDGIAYWPGCKGFLNFLFQSKQLKCYLYAETEEDVKLCDAIYADLEMRTFNKTFSGGVLPRRSPELSSIFGEKYASKDYDTLKEIAFFVSVGKSGDTVIIIDDDSSYSKADAIKVLEEAVAEDPALAEKMPRIIASFVRPFVRHIEALHLDWEFEEYFLLNEDLNRSVSEAFTRYKTSYQMFQSCIMEAISNRIRAIIDSIADGSIKGTDLITIDKPDSEIIFYALALASFAVQVAEAAYEHLDRSSPGDDGPGYNLEDYEDFLGFYEMETARFRRLQEAVSAIKALERSERALLPMTDPALLQACICLERSKRALLPMDDSAKHTKPSPDFSSIFTELDESPYPKGSITNACIMLHQAIEMMRKRLQARVKISSGRADLSIVPDQKRSLDIDQESAR